MKIGSKKTTVLLAVFLVVALGVSAFSLRSHALEQDGEVYGFYQTMIPPFWALGGMVTGLLLLLGAVKEKFTKSLRPILAFFSFVVLFALFYREQRVLQLPAPEGSLFPFVPLVEARIRPLSPSVGYAMEFLAGLFGAFALRALWWLIRERGWRDLRFSPVQLLYLLLPVALGYAEAIFFRGRTVPLAMQRNSTVGEFIGFWPWFCRAFLMIVLALPTYFLTARAVPLSRGATFTIGGIALILATRVAWLPFLHLGQSLANDNYLLYAIVRGDWPDGLLFSLPLCLAIKALWARRRPVLPGVSHGESESQG